MNHLYLTFIPFMSIVMIVMNLHLSPVFAAQLENTDSKEGEHLGASSMTSLPPREYALPITYPPPVNFCHYPGQNLLPWSAQFPSSLSPGTTQFNTGWEWPAEKFPCLTGNSHKRSQSDLSAEGKASPPLKRQKIDFGNENMVTLEKLKERERVQNLLSSVHLLKGKKIIKIEYMDGDTKKEYIYGQVRIGNLITLLLSSNSSSEAINIKIKEIFKLVTVGNMLNARYTVITSVMATRTKFNFLLSLIQSGLSNFNDLKTMLEAILRKIHNYEFITSEHFNYEFLKIINYLDDCGNSNNYMTKDPTKNPFYIFITENNSSMQNKLSRPLKKRHKDDCDIKNKEKEPFIEALHIPVENQDSTDLIKSPRQELILETDPRPEAVAPGIADDLNEQLKHSRKRAQHYKRQYKDLQIKYDTEIQEFYHQNTALKEQVEQLESEKAYCQKNHQPLYFQGTQYWQPKKEYYQENLESLGFPAWQDSFSWHTQEDDIL